MVQETFEKYLSQVQELYRKSALDECLALINRHLSHQGPLKPFFQGEHAFYQGHYELSLKYYLQAKEAPCFQFFCYRASAFVAKKMGQQEKALSLGKKALSIHPKDLPSLSLFKQDEEIETPRIALGTKELDELESLFQEQQPQEILHVEAFNPLEIWKLHIQKKQCLYVLQDGFFLRLNGKGFLINPTPHFLNSFHAKGLATQDIHAIIGSNSIANNLEKPLLKTPTQLNEIASLSVSPNQLRLQLANTFILMTDCIDTLQEIKPTLLLCNTDLENIRKLRQNGASGHILPAYNGLCIDLETLHVQCSQTGIFTHPSQIRIVKMDNSFLYLAPNCIL